MDSRQLTTVVLVILGAILLLPILGMSMWGFGMMGSGMMGSGMMGPAMMGRGGWGGLFLLVGGVALIALAFTRRESRSGEPLEILKVRLAKGEITREQYDGLKQTIQ